MEKTPVEPNTRTPSNYGTDSPAPPSYDEATGPPPSYVSLFGEIKGAHQGSSSIVEFLKKLMIILAGTIGCTIAIGLMMAIPIAMIVIGARYKDDCPVEEKIPIYLIVAGSVGVFRNLISLVHRARSSDDDDVDDSQKRRNPVASILDTFLLVWFICGNVWIYKNYHPNYDITSGSEQYCNKTLYLFAFWITTATYIMIASICCCVCCVAVCAVAFGDGS